MTKNTNLVLAMTIAMAAQSASGMQLVSQVVSQANNVITMVEPAISFTGLSKGVDLLSKGASLVCDSKTSEDSCFNKMNAKVKSTAKTVSFGYVEDAKISVPYLAKMFATLGVNIPVDLLHFVIQKGAIQLNQKNLLLLAGVNNIGKAVEQTDENAKDENAKYEYNKIFDKNDKDASFALKLNKGQLFFGKNILPMLIALGIMGKYLKAMKQYVPGFKAAANARVKVLDTMRHPQVILNPILDLIRRLGNLHPEVTPTTGVKK